MASFQVFLRALFSTCHELDMQDMPQQNKHILGITSLWMAIPIFYVLRTFRRTANDGTAMLAMLLMAVCLVSTLFWSNPKGNSFLHKADKFLAWLYCVAMIWCTIQPGEGRKLDSATFGLIIVCILVFFLLSDVFFRMNSPGLQLLAHLLFRYVFYWWSHLMMIPAETNFLSGFLVMSVGYFGHISFMYHLIDWRSSWQQERYWISCAQAESPEIDDRRNSDSLSPM